MQSRIFTLDFFLKFYLRMVYGVSDLKISHLLNNYVIKTTAASQGQTEFKDGANSQSAHGINHRQRVFQNNNTEPSNDDGDDGTRLEKNKVVFYRTYHLTLLFCNGWYTPPLLYSLRLLFGGVFVAVAVMVCLSSLFFLTLRAKWKAAVIM